MERVKAWICAIIAVLGIFTVMGGGSVFAQSTEQTAPPTRSSEQSAPAVQPGEQAAPLARPGEPLNTANKLRLQLDVYFGFGLDSNTVGKTTNNDDVKISSGGGVGFGATIGYGLSKHVDIDGTLGVQASGLQPAVKNATGTFGRSFLLATMKYKVPIRENLQWKFGVGAGYYMGGELDIDIEPGVPGAGHTIVDYKDAAGVHGTGELEIALQRNLVLTVGLKYYKVEYKADKATFNGASVPVSSLNNEYRDLTGDGVDVTVGFAVLF